MILKVKDLSQWALKTEEWSVTYITGFENEERGTQAKECGCLPEYGKSKENWFHPWVFRKEWHPAKTDFRQVRPPLVFYITVREQTWAV